MESVCGNGTGKRELKVHKERSVSDFKEDETQMKIQGPPNSISVIVYDKRNPYLIAYH
jgi:hypothetical protein